MLTQRSIFSLIVSCLSLATPIQSLEVRLSVFDPDGSSVAGARLELLPLVSGYEMGRVRLAEPGWLEPATTATTDQAGWGVLEVPSPGSWIVRVAAEGRMPMDYQPLLAVDDVELPPLTLPPAVRIEVRVRDHAGGMAGAWVVISPPGRGQPSRRRGWSPSLRAVRTGADGTSVLARAVNEAEQVTVFASGYPETWAPTTADLLEVRLAAGSERLIEALDSHGRPVVGALVRLGDLAWPAGLTGNDGRLRVPARPGEPMKVLLMTAGGSRQWFDLPVRGRPEVAPDSLTLPPGVDIAGVVRQPSGEPLAGALVWNSVDPGSFVLTDPQGRYRMVAPTEQGFRVQAELAGRYPRAKRVAAAAMRTGTAPTLVLRPSRTVRGRIVGEEGLALAGAMIEAVAAERRSFFRPDRADARAHSSVEGDFVLTGLGPGSAYTLLASSEGFVPREESFMAPAARGEILNLRIELTASRPLGGRVVNVAGLPLAGVWVMLRPTGEIQPLHELEAEEEADDDPYRLKTEDGGRFAFAAAPAARIDLAVWHDGYAPAIVRSIAVEGKEPPLDLGDLVLAPGVRLSGRVLGPDGRPIAGTAIFPLRGIADPTPGDRYQLRRRGPEGHSRADGTFLVEVPREETLSLYLEAAGFASRWLRGLQAPLDRPLEVILQRAAPLAGRVVDEEGEAVAGARVHVARFDRAANVPLPDMATAICDRAGRFELADLEPGDFRVQAQADGYTVSAPLDLTLPMTAGSDAPVLVLDRGNLVEGRVTDAAQRAVADARVLVADAVGMTDDDGRVQLSGVASGPAVIEVRHPHYGRATQEITIEPGLNRFDLELPAGYRVAGSVADRAGRGVANAWLQMRAANGEPWRDYRAVGDEEERFDFPYVVDGEYRLEAGAPGYAATVQNEVVVVAGSSREDLSVVLDCGHTLFGRVLGLEPDLLPRVTLRLESASGRERAAHADHEGRYRVEYLPSDSWLLVGSLAAGRRQAQARVELADCQEAERDLEFQSGFELAGRVFFDSSLLPATQVALTGRNLSVKRTAVTDPRGEFRIDGLELGSYRVAFSNARERVADHQTVEVAADVWLDVELAGADASGYVFASDTLEPVTGAMIRFLRQPDEYGAEELLVVDHSNEDGSFALSRLPAGRYRVTVRKERFAVTERELTLIGGQQMGGLHFELDPTDGLRARIRRHDGSFPEQASLRLVDSTGQRVLEAARPVDSAGALDLPTAPGGRWQMAVKAPGTAVYRGLVDIPGPRVDIVLPSAGGLDVTIPELTSSDLIATLWLFDAEMSPFDSLSPEGRAETFWPVIGGRVRVDGLPAGGWQLLIEAPDGRRWSGEILTSGSGMVQVALD